MNLFLLALRRLALEHRTSLQEEPGGTAWLCLCGERSPRGGGYRTTGQARHAAQRHIDNALERTQHEYERSGGGGVIVDQVTLAGIQRREEGERVEIGGCGASIVFDEEVRTCTNHNRFWFRHGDRVAMWDDTGLYAIASTAPPDVLTRIR